MIAGAVALLAVIGALAAADLLARVPVIGDDVDAHQWVLLINPAARCRRWTHSRSLWPPKPLHSG
jgi:hypothetical protein